MRETDATGDARAMLRRASDGLRDVRLRAPALAAAVAWRSPAVAEFGKALDEWVRLLDSLGEQIGQWDDELSRATRQRGGLEGR